MKEAAGREEEEEEVRRGLDAADGQVQNMPVHVQDGQHQHVDPRPAPLAVNVGVF